MELLPWIRLKVGACCVSLPLGNHEKSTDRLFWYLANVGLTITITKSSESILYLQEVIPSEDSQQTLDLRRIEILALERTFELPEKALQGQVLSLARLHGGRYERYSVTEDEYIMQIYRCIDTKGYLYTIEARYPQRFKNNREVWSTVPKFWQMISWVD